MSNTPKRNNQITVRFTDFETGFLSWYAKHIDTDRTNSIRHVLCSFLADHDQLVAQYLEYKGFNHPIHEMTRLEREEKEQQGIRFEEDLGEE